MKQRAAAQSKTHSLIEALVNVAIGYCIAVTAQIVIFPIFGVHISIRQNIEIGIIMTAVSIVRSYTLRRVFNHWHLAAHR
ncbi:MAG: hypothetical protein JO001_10215 [Alphaproteobacteria bacterium]|nr:hypothetical protein [Alphaproteobacteria bacterium]